MKNKAFLNMQSNFSQNENLIYQNDKSLESSCKLAIFDPASRWVNYSEMAQENLSFSMKCEILKLRKKFLKMRNSIPYKTRINTRINIYIKDTGKYSYKSSYTRTSLYKCKSLCKSSRISPVPLIDLWFSPTATAFAEIKQGV